jgi:hypothetical protein
MIPNLIFISRLGSSAVLCFVFRVPVQLVRTRLFQRPGARFSSDVSCCLKFFCSARVDRPLDQVFHSRSRIPLKRSFLYCLARGFRWCHRRSFIFATEIFFPGFILRQKIPFSLRQCPIFISVGGQLEAFPEGIFFLPLLSEAGVGAGLFSFSTAQIGARFLLRSSAFLPCCLHFCQCHSILQQLPAHPCRPASVLA